MRAVVTVIGKDMVGILSKVSGACAGANANVIEVTQSVLQDMFAMIMLVDISQLKLPFDQTQPHPACFSRHPCSFYPCLFPPFQMISNLSVLSYLIQ